MPTSLPFHALLHLPFGRGDRRRRGGRQGERTEARGAAYPCRAGDGAGAQPEAALEAAQRISHSLFSGSLDALTESDFEQLAQDGVPGVTLEKTVISLIDALVASRLAKSKSEARGFLQSGSVTVNGHKVDALDHQFADAERLFGRFTLLRRGKKNYAMINWI